MTNSTTRYRIIHRLIQSVAVVALALVATLSSCTHANTELGSNFTPSNQGLKIGQLNLKGINADGESYFSTKLFKSDSINAANQKNGFLGAMRNDTFGMRTAGFYTQYIPGNKLEDDVFGYRPIFDSMMLYLSIADMAGDTTFKQKYEIYEVIDNEFIKNSTDTIFFTNFYKEIDNYLAPEPIFSFTFPDQDNGIYTTTTALRLTTTDASMPFIDRLMLEDGPTEYDSEIYDNDEEWVEQFKGIYIRPVDSNLGTSGTKGAIFANKTEKSGFGFYGRNREESDSSLIQDTIGMTYLFFAEEAKAGNVSISTVEHDYSSAIINRDEVATSSDDDVANTSTLYVEGMGGVVSEITLTKELFAELDTILGAEQSQSGEEYTSLFFNQAQMMIYMTQVDEYDAPQNINPSLITPWMDYMPQRLGMYLNYSNYLATDDNDETLGYTLVGIGDYAYIYEEYYDTTLDYGGSMNRSWGCYVMNVASYIQSVWNSYLVAKEAAGGDFDKIEWDNIAGRKIYLAPLAGELFSLKYATAQGEASPQNGAPIRLELTYTMIR